MASACSIKVRGVVQGVGFRPFVFRLARANTLAGWVLNGDEGVEIFLEGADQGLQAFVHALKTDSPPAAQITDIEVQLSNPVGYGDFTIRESVRKNHPSARISPDLPVCNDCLSELFDPADRRFLYPYINCTNCGPRYSVLLAVPYDRKNTTMRPWPLDEFCASEYDDPGNRRFHAQPVACPICGPAHYLQIGDQMVRGNEASIRAAAEMLKAGKILAVKGLGGYHLACDAKNADAVRSLRNRKFRKEKPFALMAKNLEVARKLVRLSADAETLLNSVARPIVLAPANLNLLEVAPDNSELGVMLPYTPLHHLLFAAGAPDVLVMTSANRSSEPIAFDDIEALDRLSGIADAFLIGERPIARRLDDSIAGTGVFGPTILRRARGYAPSAVAVLPAKRPILALGADLKNTITLVVDGQAFVSQHIGDLEHFQSLQSFQQTIEDLVSMYEVPWDELLVVHDCHPQYASTIHAGMLSSAEKRGVQHHRAHLASAVAEHGAWDEQVIGVCFDGTGYGDDGTIWGGEIFTGSVRGGFERIAHLRRAVLAGGDAAAHHPVQAAAGFLAQIDDLPDVSSAPFFFPERYQHSVELIRKSVRTFATSSMGRLFDTAAALLGFTRDITFEGQAAMWLGQLARRSSAVKPYPFPFVGKELDFGPLLAALARDRFHGRDLSECARAFQGGIADGLSQALGRLGRAHETETIVFSGGVFQNELLLEDLKGMLQSRPFKIWTNHAVPANDGGISLGQAALGAFGQFNSIAPAASQETASL
ncbi:MAG TPA: carbamoyltransferase HypF [Terriglobales bacterium]|nr:carbamoyltransferase HypF [Terriglobales bacterium]